MSAEPPLDTNPNQGGDQPPTRSPAQDGRPKTPPNTKPPRRVNEDTPYKPSSTQAHEYLNGDLDSQREAVVDDLSYSVLELEDEYFLDFILPPLKDDFNVDAIVAALQDKGLVGLDGEALLDFATKPKDSRLKEDKVFEPLSKIFEEAVNAANGQGQSLEQTLTMRLLPNEGPFSTKRNIRPDGYLLLKEADDRADKAREDREAQRAAKAKESKKDKEADTNRYWYDIAVTQEFKKYKNNFTHKDDVSKVVYGLQVMMSLDPSRRFAFGITIENTDLRVWFCSRGLVAVSKAIDFTTNAAKLVKIYLKLAYASKDELGWDPTVQVSNMANDTPTCRIQVGETIYETVEVLSSFAAETIVGRGTRVYRVKDTNTGKHYVLKDVWIEDNRAPEHEIRETILKEVEGMFDTDIRKEVEKHLLTPFAHWLVPVGEKTDHTVEVMMHGKEPDLSKTLELVITNNKIDDRAKGHGWSAASDNEVGGKMMRHLGTPLPRGNDKEKRKPHRRRHYRIVFEEVAEPVFALTRLSDMFIVLRDVAKVLYYIHACGFVHRDISAGNLYLFAGRGLLGDLEYAKRKLDDLQHELLTGTLDFMAVEAIGRKYYFNVVDPDDIAEQKESQLEREREGVATSTDNPTRDVPPFFHNDLHDMESLWWISIWILFFYRNKSCAEDDEGKIKARQSSASRVFPRNLVNDDRREFLRTEYSFNEMLDWIDDSLVSVKKHLEFLRYHLHGRYRTFERTFPDYTFEAFKGVQAKFQTYFDYCVSLASEIELAPFKTTGLRGTKGDTRDGGHSTQNPPTVPTPLLAPAPDHAPDTPPEPAMPLPDPVTSPPDSSTSSLLGKRKVDDDVYMPRPRAHRPIDKKVVARHQP